MNKILFRADSSSTIGTGHIMRDLVLASQLTKQFPHAKIVFATQELEGNINYKIIEAGYKIVNLITNEKEELLEVIKAWHVEMLVIDHYRIDHKDESFFKKNSDLQILSFDDSYEKHNCDILLNHNIYADAQRYKNLVPKSCELRCGLKQTLLREEFYKEKEKKREKSTKKKTIFLAMGGADHSHINIKILKLLEKFENLKVNVVSTNANQHLKELQKYVKNRAWINLHINSDKIAKLMRKSNLAIVTPSVTLNEIFFLQIPFIAIKTAKNQDEMYKYLKKNKYLVLGKFKDKKLKNSLELLLKKDTRNAK